MLVSIALLSISFVSCANGQSGTNAMQSGATVATASTCDLQHASYTIRQLGSWSSDLNNGWAPDSQHRAYAADGQIKIFDTQTNITTATLTPSMNAVAPEWSADGTHIFFSARPPTVKVKNGPNGALTLHTPPEMYVMNANGSDLQQVTLDSPLPSGSSMVYWDSLTPAKFSPDGKHIAFSTLQGLTSESLSGMQHANWIMLMGNLVTVNGTPHLRNVHQLLAPSPDWHEAKGFTRDSQDLLFGASTGTGLGSSPFNADVYTLNLATGAITRYTSNPAWEETMDVNPVSDFIVFNSNRDNPTPALNYALGSAASGHHDLYLAGPQGDAGWTRRLTTDGNPDKGGWASLQPHWSPNGRAIFFQQSLKAVGKGLVAQRMMLLTFTCPATA